MKLAPIYTIIFIKILSFQSLPCKSQEKPVWSEKFPKSINWYSLNPAGIFLVCTNTALYGLDPQKNGIAWELKDFAGIEMEKVSRYNQTPYIAINKFDPGSGGGLMSSTFKTFKKWDSKSYSIDRIILIDPMNGDIVFDIYANELGFDNIEKKNYLSEINCILLQGTKNKQRSFGLYDLNTRKMRFLVEKPVKLKMFTLRDDLDYYVHPSGNLIVRYANNTYQINITTGGQSWKRMNDSLYQFVFGSDKASTYASGGKFISKIDSETGDIIQQITPSELLENKETQQDFLSNLYTSGIKLLPLPDKLMATYKGGVNFFDYYTLSPLWNKVLKFDGMSVINIKPVKDSNLLIFLRNISNTQTSIILVDSTSKLLWNKPYTIQGSIIKMLETNEKGILCVTNVQADIISWENGKSKLKEPLKFETDKYVMVAHAQPQNSLAFYNDGKVYEINYETNIVRKILDKTNFKGGDTEDKQPTWLEARQNGYFLSASQNVMLIGFDGNIKYNNYYNRPGMSDKAKKMLAFGGGVALGFVFSEQAQQLTNEMYTSGLMSADNFITIKAMDSRAGTGSALITGGLSNIAFSELSERRRIVETGNRPYQLVLAKLNNNHPGFLKIDKESGAILTSLDLSDRDPAIKIDDALSALYYVDDKEVFFYSMK